MWGSLMGRPPKKTPSLHQVNVPPGTSPEDIGMRVFELLFPTHDFKAVDQFTPGGVSYLEIQHPKGYPVCSVFRSPYDNGDGPVYVQAGPVTSLNKLKRAVVKVQGDYKP